jgi:hypothetical protein
MAMTVKTGIGTSQVNPTLTDGWMLSSLTASADSEVSQTLTALGSIVGTLTGAGGKAAAGAAAKTVAAPGNGPPAAAGLGDLKDYYAAGHFILKPGLYRFTYDSSGKLTGLDLVTSFQQ